MTKVSQMSLADFRAYIKKNAIWDQSVQSGLPEKDLDAIVQIEYQEHPNISVTRAETKILKSIQERTKLLTATSIKGCLIGSRDKPGKSPTRFYLIKKDKNHIELSNFGTKTIFKENDEFEIPIPSLATVKANHDPQYDSWNLLAIEEIGTPTNKMTKDFIKSILTQVEIPLSAINASMAYAPGRAAKVICISGKIGRIDPEVNFERVKQADGSEKAVKTSSNPLLVANETGELLPCCNFGIKSSGGRYIRCHLEKQKYGKPLVLVEDFHEFCMEAVKKYPDNPQEQARYIGEYFSGESSPTVFVVGVVSSYKDTYNKENKPITNIEINVAAMIEIIGGVEGNPGQSTLEPNKQPGLPKSTHTEVPSPPRTEVPSPPRTGMTQVGTQTVVGAQANQFQDVVKDLQLFCQAADISPDQLTLEVIQTRALDRFEDIPQGIMIGAIEFVKAQKGG